MDGINRDCDVKTFAGAVGLLDGTRTPKQSRLQRIASSSRMSCVTSICMGDSDAMGVGTETGDGSGDGEDMDTMPGTSAAVTAAAAHSTSASIDNLSVLFPLHSSPR